ncbi:hypothetical protein GLOTRDRAFT_128465 [Gloeophyllum trabeum ATCC 11539]|uniref:Uncharacterized protein n=1 Tax=Gloeophyllum trabeum (strain ATCC 11539 / FP-39264 / Madison 617) TaxID=670483 RepID=S7QB15_GLOTA|nr:uncharacterized protein GLOTRDRAFT_128465 [Gloeophyllum trabeum ATCC 11539]EPQ56523.1 hypothetical protein GLOTRDRAFT_128465 [Gloeophyllum trabeum ATCC 11539]
MALTRTLIVDDSDLTHTTSSVDAVSVKISLPMPLVKGRGKRSSGASPFTLRRRSRTSRGAEHGIAPTEKEGSLARRTGALERLDDFVLVDDSDLEGSELQKDCYVTTSLSSSASHLDYELINVVYEDDVKPLSTVSSPAVVDLTEPLDTDSACTDPCPPYSLEPILEEPLDASCSSGAGLLSPDRHSAADVSYCSTASDASIDTLADGSSVHLPEGFLDNLEEMERLLTLPSRPKPRASTASLNSKENAPVDRSADRQSVSRSTTTTSIDTLADGGEPQLPPGFFENLQEMEQLITSHSGEKERKNEAPSRPSRQLPTIIVTKPQRRIVRRESNVIFRGSSAGLTKQLDYDYMDEMVYEEDMSYSGDHTPCVPPQYADFLQVPQVDFRGRIIGDDEEEDEEEEEEVPFTAPTIHVLLKKPRFNGLDGLRSLVTRLRRRRPSSLAVDELMEIIDEDDLVEDDDY